MVVDEKREHEAGDEQELDPERVELRIPVVSLVGVGEPGGLELDLHEVDDVERGEDEEELHERVVERDEVCDEVEVARAEDEQVDCLGLERDACAQRRLSMRTGCGPRRLDLQQQDQDGRQMQQICD